MTRRRRILTWVILGTAARVVVRLGAGRADFLRNSYDFYRVIAESLLAGRGLCYTSAGCALRLPAYPLLLTPFIATGTLFPLLVFLQAVIGGVLVWAAYATARALFGDRAGVLAGAMAAISPYALVHDTALQETVLVNMALALAVLWLLRWSASGRAIFALAAGAALALAAMTTARVLPLVAWAVFWPAVSPRSRANRPARAVFLTALPVVLCVGAWVGRNWMVVGSPVITTESGASLWLGNNADTLRYFPARTIDLLVPQSFAALHDREPASFEAVSADPVRFDRFLNAHARAYIASHPGAAMHAALVKVWVVVSARLSPSRGRAADLAFRAIYAGLNIVAVIGFWMRGAGDRRRWLIAGMVVMFLFTTAVFWAHTSHASVIHAWTFVYAAAAIDRVWPGRQGDAGTRQV